LAADHHLTTLTPDLHFMALDTTAAGASHLAHAEVQGGGGPRGRAVKRYRWKTQKDQQKQQTEWFGHKDLRNQNK
jgi:hypothetical protein